MQMLVYNTFILIRLYRELLAYRNTIEYVPGINQYWEMSVKFLTQANNGLPMTGFEPMRLSIFKLILRRVNHSNTPPTNVVWSHGGGSLRCPSMMPSGTPPWSLLVPLHEDEFIREWSQFTFCRIIILSSYFISLHYYNLFLVANTYHTINYYKRKTVL